MNGQPDEFAIIADHREDPSGILTMLAADGLFDVQREHLGCGDYIVFDLVIERKTTVDFVNSLEDGRLFRQLFYMRRLYRRRCLIIEGESAFRQIHRPYEAALLKISAGFQTPIIWSSSAAHTSIIIRRMALQLYKLTTSSPVIRNPERKEDLDFQQRYVLIGLPGVGLARADALLSKFGSLERVFLASEAELAETTGVGPKLAKRMRDLLMRG